VLISEKIKKNFLQIYWGSKTAWNDKKMKLKRRRRKETKKLIFMINNFNFATPLN
jgi:hypothetical protein